MLRSVLRSSHYAAVAAAAKAARTSSLVSAFLASRAYSKAATKGKAHAVSAEDTAEDVSTASDEFDADFELPGTPLPPSYDPALDVGPGGHPLFTRTNSFASLTRKEACTYVDFSLEECHAMLPEGLLAGMTKEFEETRRCALMVRQCFLDLRDNFKRTVDPPLRSGYKSSKKQIVLDGPVSCGKSITLAMLVHWARSEGWLVFYVPQGKEWSHGGFYYKNLHNELWDTPVQAAKTLQFFLYRFLKGRAKSTPKLLRKDQPHYVGDDA